MCGSKTLSTLSGTCVSPPSRRARVCVEDARHQRLHLLQPLARLRQGRGGRGRRGAEPLTDAAHHRRGVADDGARRRHQLAITADQGVPRLGRSRLTSDDQHAPADAAQAIAHAPARITQGRTRRAASSASARARRPAAASCRSDSAHSFLRPWCRCEIDGRA